MEELGSVWSYQETVDELKQKLLYTTIELESLKAEASEEMRKHNQDVKNLIELLKIAYQERDAAKERLQKIINKLLPCSPTNLHSIVAQAQPESPLIMPAKANSSITESNSLSDTYNNHQSHGSPHVDSLFDAVTSPEFSSINMSDSGFINKALVEEYKGCLVTPAVVKVDPSDAVIDNLVKGKALPCKGKLLQTVMDAGPLLQTLLVAGPLPRWRNPPPLQPLKIPPVSIKGAQTANACNQKPLSNSPPYLEMSRGSSQTCSASILNFSSNISAPGLGNGWLLNSGSLNQVPAGKRQRFH